MEEFLFCVGYRLPVSGSQAIRFSISANSQAVNYFSRGNWRPVTGNLVFLVIFVGILHATQAAYISIIVYPYPVKCANIRR
jgi:hypothetical protein